QMLEIAHVVTTNTDGFRRVLVREHAGASVELLPDPIDYARDQPVARPLRSGRPLRLLWFGNCNNLSMLAPHQALARHRSCRLVICTHLCQATAALQAEHPEIE